MQVNTDVEQKLNKIIERLSGIEQEQRLGRDTLRNVEEKVNALTTRIEGLISLLAPSARR